MKKFSEDFFKTKKCFYIETKINYNDSNMQTLNTLYIHIQAVLKVWKRSNNSIDTQNEGKTNKIFLK